MYQKIAGHPTVREIWARTLVSRGAIDPSLPDQLAKKDMDQLQSVLDALQPERDLVEPLPEAPPPGAAARANTAVPLDRLEALNASLLSTPPGFSVHRKLERAREKRHQLLAQPDERTIDWSAAEELAFATILADGTSIRLTGEDVERARSATGTRSSTTEDRSHPRAAPELAGARAGFEIPQQSAVGERRPRLRVRLQRAGAVPAW
jgi:2-oxoglutarate dehydrogenase E1 component